MIRVHFFSYLYFELNIISQIDRSYYFYCFSNNKISGTHADDITMPWVHIYLSGFRLQDFPSYHDALLKE